MTLFVAFEDTVVPDASVLLRDGNGAAASSSSVALLGTAASSVLRDTAEEAGAAGVAAAGTLPMLQYVAPPTQLVSHWPPPALYSALMTMATRCGHVPRRWAVALHEELLDVIGARH